MANISDALAAFAAGPLGKAAGQDFLSPMLEQARQKDMIAYQRKVAEDGINKERERRKQENFASRKALLSALAASGAVAQEDLIASGGVDILAGLGDGEFELGLQAMSERRMRSLSQQEFIAATKGKMLASGLTPTDAMTYDQAVTVNSQLDYKQVTRAQQQQQSKEVSRSIGDQVASLHQEAQTLLQNPLALKSGAASQFLGRVAALRSKIGAEAADLDPDDAEALLGRTDLLMQNVEFLRSQEHANAYASQPAETIIATWGRLDPLLQEATASRRPVINILTALGQKMDTLSRMSEEEATALNLQAAWSAVQGVKVPEELLANPTKALTVFKAPTEGADRTLQDRTFKQQAEARAAELKAELNNLARAGGDFKAIADGLAALPSAAEVTGSDGKYIVNEAAILDAAAAPLRARIPSMSMRDLQALDVGFSFQKGSAAGAQLWTLVGPAIMERRRSLLVDATPADLKDVGDSGVDFGLEEVSNAAQSLFNDEGKVDKQSFARMSGGVNMALSADIQAQTEAAEAEIREAREALAASADDPALAYQRGLVQEGIDRQAALLEASTSAHNTLNDVFRMASLGVKSGDAWPEAAAKALTNQLGRQFQTVGFGEAAFTTLQTEIEKMTTAGGDPVEMVLEIMLVSADELSKSVGGDQELKIARANAVRDEVAKWRAVYDALPDIEDNQVGEIGKAMGFARPKDIKPKAVLFSHIVSNRQ